MQITPENEKGLNAANAQTPMQTGTDSASKPGRRQPPEPSLNPRQARILRALLERKRTREEIDAIAGVSNGPDEIFRLRHNLGLRLPCPRKAGIDMDGKPVEIGVYGMAESDYSIALRLLGNDPEGVSSCPSPAPVPPRLLAGVTL